MNYIIYNIQYIIYNIWYIIYKCEIFSLGLIFLSLLHPTNAPTSYLIISFLLPPLLLYCSVLWEFVLLFCLCSWLFLEGASSGCYLLLALLVFPQQRKLMGSSAQNSFGVHWCRRRVRFNEVLEKVPKVREALVQSQVRFIQQGSGEGSGQALGGFGAGPGRL